MCYHSFMNYLRTIILNILVSLNYTLAVEDCPVRIS